MTDAGGTTTLNVISTEGPYMLYKISNDSVDDGETIPFDGPSNSPVVAEDQVIVVGGLNETTEKQIGAGGTASVEYDETAMHFTFTESGATADVVTIWFYHLVN